MQQMKIILESAPSTEATSATVLMCKTSKRDPFPKILGFLPKSIILLIPGTPPNLMISLNSLNWPRFGRYLHPPIGQTLVPRSKTKHTPNGTSSQKHTTNPCRSISTTQTQHMTHEIPSVRILFVSINNVLFETDPAHYPVFQRQDSSTSTPSDSLTRSNDRSSLTPISKYSEPGLSTRAHVFFYFY